MTLLFDIFHAKIGGVLWIGSAATQEDAKARVQELAARSGGEYVVLNQSTGSKSVIRIEGRDGEPSVIQNSAKEVSAQ